MPTPWTTIPVAEIGTEPIQCSGTDVNPLSSVTFIAHPDNTGILYVGASDVSADDGIPLGPGQSYTDEHVLMLRGIYKLSDVYVISDDTAMEPTDRLRIVVK